MAPPRKRTNPEWQKTPEWRLYVERVLNSRDAGLKLDSIHAIVGGDKSAIKRILEDEEECEIRDRQIYSEKVPTIKSIINLSLNAINETLKDITIDKELRKQMLSKASDIGALVKAVDSLNLLLRLELDQSTKNVAVVHNYQDTRKALQDIAKVDPVFSYPELPEPSKDE
jgi:hypothetical protein